MAEIPVIASPVTEQAILAYALRNPKEYSALADIISPDSFNHRPYGWVWRAMGSLESRGMGIDAVTVGDELDRAGQLDQFCNAGGSETSGIQFRGRAAISELKRIQTTESGEAYAITVQDYAAKRKIGEWLQQAVGWAHNGRRAHEIMTDLETSFGSLTLHSGKITGHTATSGQAAIRGLDAARMASRGDRALSTGLIDLDKILGITKTELITFAARPGQGKSALLATIALNAAHGGKRIKLFALEMGVTQVTQRFLSQISGVSAFRIMQGKLSDSEWEKVEAAAEEFSTLPLTICDLPAIRTSQIRTEARKSEIDALMLDYVQLAQSDTKNDRRDLDIGEVTRGLKAIALELDIPVLQAAQMSRAVEARGDHRPLMSDLRESGSIENDSDSVVFIYQKTDFDPHELIIAKHRNGPVGFAPAMFLKETMRFVDSTTREIHIPQARRDVD